jgi:DNA-binding MarR family transcriptional regulator
VTDAEGTTEDLEGPGLVFQVRIGYLLGTVGSVVYQRWAEALGELGVTPTQAKMLMALGDAGPLGQQRLAELVGVDPRNAVAVVESLVEAGLVSRAVDPSDRRRRVLALTSRGRRLAKKLVASTTQHDDDLLASLPAADRETLRRLLSAVLHASKGGR